MRKVEADTIATRIEHTYPEIDVVVSHVEGNDQEFYLSLWTKDNKAYFMLDTVEEWIFMCKVLSVFCPTRENIGVNIRPS